MLCNFTVAATAAWLVAELVVTLVGSTFLNLPFFVLFFFKIIFWLFVDNTKVFLDTDD